MSDVPRLVCVVNLSLGAGGARSGASFEANARAAHESERGI